MFEGWDNYFVLTGTAAGGLIGLLFVVVTLTAGFERSRALRGSEIYMTPNLVHFAVVLVAGFDDVAFFDGRRVGLLVVRGWSVRRFSGSRRSPAVRPRCRMP